MRINTTEVYISSHDSRRPEAERRGLRSPTRETLITPRPHADHVPDANAGRRRGQRLYDRWGRYAFPYRVVDAMTAPLRAEAVDELALGDGDVAVDLGCGPGASLPALREAVGPDGVVAGVDYSAAMAGRAGDRARALSPVSVLRADAAALPLATNTVDGVFASLALSAMPEIRAVVDEIKRVLRPGGRLAVLDARVPDGALGGALAGLFGRTVNFRHRDALRFVREAFPSTTVVREFDAGLGFVARAEAD
jgi:SAM-dependent methyltransferase